MTDIILYGCNGTMGNAVREAVSLNDSCRIVAGVDLSVKGPFDFPVYTDISQVAERADVVIDFSHPSTLNSILTFLKSKPGLAAILCTTGYSQEQVADIQKKSSELPLFYSRNMSLGVNLLIELAKKAAQVLGDGFDIEIVEQHHNKKIDAPSGTALMIADAICQDEGKNMRYVYDRHSQRKKREKDEIGIHAIRGGSIVGEHQVLFAGQHETLSLSHSAQSKELFATGAVNAAVFMTGKEAGLYDMSDLI